MKALAVIPARGGSKGVPQKNIKLLGGKPLLQYTFETAKSSKLLSKVILSTDSEEIAEVGRQMGLTVPFIRPEHLALDNTPTLPVLQHAVQFLEEKGEVYDVICLLQPTNPFRAPHFIDKALQKLKDSKADSLISVLQVPHEYNPHWVFESNENDVLSIATGEKHIIPRRQELPKAYHRDGALYLVKKDVLLYQHSLFGEAITYLESDPKYYVNIDTSKDWLRAEQTLKNLSVE